MILILLFLSEFYLGILTSKNAKHFKNGKRRTNANSMANICMTEDEKKNERNGTNFYWVMLLTYTIWEYRNILTHEDLIQIFLPDFWDNFSQNIFKKYLKQLSTQRLDIVQNVLISSSPKISHGDKCANALILYATNIRKLSLWLTF